MPKSIETRLAKVSGSCNDVRLVEDVLKAFYSYDLQEIERLMQSIKGRDYLYKFHKLKQRGEGALFDLSFAFIQQGGGE